MEIILGTIAAGILIPFIIASLMFISFIKFTAKLVTGLFKQILGGK